MAVSTAIVSRNVVGSQRMNIVDVTMDDSYPTAGEQLTAGALGIRSSVTAAVAFQNPLYVGMLGSDLKLELFNIADGAEVTNATDLTGVVIRLLVIGD